MIKHINWRKILVQRKSLRITLQTSIQYWLVAVFQFDTDKKIHIAILRNKRPKPLLISSVDEETNHQSVMITNIYTVMSFSRLKSLLITVQPINRFLQ